jgi:hypothetical protein
MQQVVEQLLHNTIDTAACTSSRWAGAMSNQTRTTTKNSTPQPTSSSPMNVLFAIQTNHRVTKIEYSITAAAATMMGSSKSPKVAAKSPPIPQWYLSCRVMMLPLGVLKQSIRPCSSSGKDNDEKRNASTSSFSSRMTTNAVGGGVTFVPPLPKWKQAVIA